MTLKRCTCGQLQTTKNSDFRGSMQLDPALPRLLLFNCRSCHSTFCIAGKPRLARVG